MELSLETVQNLAPDQASLNAAKKLLSPAKWQIKSVAPEVNSIWGVCQGSGANPYYVMADVVDHGYKCTCPSRKFPCKHVLALMWQFSLDSTQFTPDTPPEWVSEWLGRRRKNTSSSPAEPESSAPKPKKSIALADDTAASSQETLSPEELEKRELAKAKRAESNRLATQKAIASGIQDFQQWVNDQLRTGIDELLKDLPKGCRQIAARMVDAKATGLASRLDEIPGKVMGLPLHEQAQRVLNELGKLVLLTNAWLAEPDDPDAKRTVGVAENRDQILQNADVTRVTGRWIVLGNQSFTRRDGLVSHTTWLICAGSTSQEDPDNAKGKFAQLLDFYPASSGKKNVGFAAGTQLDAEMVYYPSRFPLRALMATWQPVNVADNMPWPERVDCPHTSWRKMLDVLPWGEVIPMLPGSTQILCGSHNENWLQFTAHNTALKQDTSQPIPVFMQGSELSQSFVLWNGYQAQLFAGISSKWGCVQCQ